jgi:hypothetical protein
MVALAQLAPDVQRQIIDLIRSTADDKGVPRRVRQNDLAKNTVRGIMAKRPTNGETSQEPLS